MRNYPGVCSVCHKRTADKTNSHLIPSFLTCMVGSVDDKYRRGKEILYTIGEHITTAHIGQEVLPDQLEECFDEISDDRLSELSQTDVALDYIFCDHCEKRLAEYLESPYSTHLSQGKKIAGDVSLFFWISVLWRMSHYKILHFRLPTHIEASFGKRLNAYIERKDEDLDTSHVLEKLPFNYRILHCKGYSEHGAGFVYGEYDKRSKTASVVFGDIIVCLDFSKKGLDANYKFYGIENILRKAPMNDGMKPEQMLEVSKSDLEPFNAAIVDMMQHKRLKSDREMVLQFWSLLRERHAPNFPPRPCEEFIRVAIRSIYDNDAKTGEKITYIHYAKAMGVALEKVYGIKIQK